MVVVSVVQRMIALQKCADWCKFVCRLTLSEAVEDEAETETETETETTIPTKITEEETGVQAESDRNHEHYEAEALTEV